MRAHRGVFVFAIVALVAGGCGAGRRALMPSAHGAMEPRPEGASRVVFVGRRAAWNVRVVDETGEFVGDCAGDLWWTIDLPPGHHAFTAWCRGEAPAHLEADLEP